MYVPRAFAVDDIKILHQQMQASPLPVLVTHASQGLLANPNPQDHALAHLMVKE